MYTSSVNVLKSVLAIALLIGQRCVYANNKFVLAAVVDDVMFGEIEFVHRNYVTEFGVSPSVFVMDYHVNPAIFVMGDDPNVIVTDEEIPRKFHLESGGKSNFSVFTSEDGVKYLRNYNEPYIACASPQNMSFYEFWKWEDDLESADRCHTTELAMLDVYENDKPVPKEISDSGTEIKFDSYSVVCPKALCYL